MQFWVVFSSIKIRELVPPSCFLARDIESHCHSVYKLHCPGVLQPFVLQHLSCFSKLQVIRVCAEFWFLFWSVMTRWCCQMVLLGYTAQRGPPKSEGKLQVVLSLTCQLGILSPLLVNGFSWVWNQSPPIQIMLIFSVKKNTWHILKHLYYLTRINLNKPFLSLWFTSEILPAVACKLWWLLLFSLVFNY